MQLPNISIFNYTTQLLFMDEQIKNSIILDYILRSFL